MNANLPKEQAKNRRSSNYGASLTNQPISENFGHTAGALQSAFRADVLVGVVAITSAATAKHQHTNLLGLWADGKTIAITASTNQSATADASTDALTIAAHGYVDNQPVVVSASSMPGGVEPLRIYWVKVVDANTIQLRTSSESSSLVDITSTGTSVLVTAVRAFSIPYLPTVAGDQSHMPLRSSGRIVLTTGAGDSVDVLSIKINQED